MFFVMVKSWARGLVRMQNALMINKCSREIIALYVEKPLKSSTLTRLKGFGSRNGQTRKRLKKPRELNVFWPERSVALDVVQQMFIGRLGFLNYGLHGSAETVVIAGL